MEHLIIKYLQGEASEAEKEQLLSWLEKGEEQRNEFLELRDLWLAAGNIPTADVDFKNKALVRFERNVATYESRKNKRRHTLLRLRTAAAVAILAIALSGGYFAGMNHGRKESHRTENVVTRFVMGKDSKGPVTLPDGTIAWLHSDSKLTYPGEFTGDKRRVILEGEGYFEVARNEKMPFIVETNQMEITVLGTCFNIRNYNYQKSIETTLLSGTVEVFFPAIDRRIMMEPDQRIRWDRETGEYKLSKVDAHNYIVWINDKMVFTKHRLSDIIFHLERWYNIEIVCDDGIDLSQQLTLTVRRELKEEIFKLLGMIASLQYEIDGDKVYLKKRS